MLLVLLWPNTLDNRLHIMRLTEVNGCDSARHDGKASLLTTTTTTHKYTYIVSIVITLEI